MTSKSAKDKLKMLTMLGLDPAEVLKGVFTTQTAGKATRSGWRVFWEFVASDSRLATTVVADVLERMLSLLEKSPPNYGVTVDSVVNTATFILLNYEIDVNEKRLKTVLDVWKKREKEVEFVRRYPPAKDVIRTLTLKIEKEDMMSFLLVQCSTLHTTDEFQKLTDVVNVPTLPVEEARFGDGAGLYSTLKRSVDNATKFKTMLSSMVTKILSLPQQMKMNPKVAESTLLALMHMLKNFITLTPITDKQWLTKTTAVLQQFYLWPCPFSNVAREVLLLLQKEALAPGHAMRQRLLNESRKTFIRGFPAEDGQESRPAYIVVETSDRRSITYCDTMEVMPVDEKTEKKKSTKEASSLISVNTKVTVICNLLKNEGALAEEDVTGLKTLPEVDINTVFERVLKLTDSLSVKAQQTQEVKSKSYADIKTQIKTLSAAAVAAKKNPAKLGTIPSDYAFHLPPILPLMCQADIKWTCPTKEQISFMNLTSTPYPDCPSVEILRSLLEEHKPNFDEMKNTDLRIVVAGSDKLLNNMLCSWLYIRQVEEDSLKNLNLKFYILPTARNHMAAFLARYDSWYNRHVWQPFRSSLYMLPWMSEHVDSGSKGLNKKGDDNEDDELTPPGKFFRRLLDDFLREAEHVVKFHIYKVEAWFKNESDKVEKKGEDSAGQPDQMIPFLQRIELGVSVAAEQFRDKKKMPEGTKLDDILKDKTFLYTPGDMKLKFTQVDLNGKASTTHEDDATAYQSILLSSVPRLGDKCFPPDPTQPWLEMHGTSFKPKNKAEIKKNVLLLDPKQHVNFVEITSDASTPFHISVDGALFGPYTKIRVSHVTEGKDKKPMTFDVQTFFPLSI